MKMRKHLKGKRLVSAQQLGFDRVIDLQFGNRFCVLYLKNGSQKFKETSSPFI